MEDEREGQGRDNQQRRQHEVDTQHRGVVARGAAVGVSAGLEGQETIDRAQLEPGIGDVGEVARGIKRKPGRQHVAGPEMQEDRNQRDLLRDPQQQLNEIGGPALQDSLQAAGNAHHALPIVARANGTSIKVMSRGLSQVEIRLGIKGRPTRRSSASNAV